MDEINERVRAVVVAHARLPVEAAGLGDDDDLFAAGMTSHASVNVMLALEEAFDVEFPNAALRKSTFQSIAAMAHAVDVLVEPSPSA